MQTLLVGPGYVLDNQGIIKAGYSTNEQLKFNRKSIKALPWRIKEWDFYQIRNENICLQFTIGHASYVGQIGIMMFDFQKKELIVKEEILLPLCFSSLNMPETAQDDHELIFDQKDMVLVFRVVNELHTITCKYKDFEASIELTRLTPKSIVVNIPFENNKKQFYCNHKISCMQATGYARYRDTEYDFTNTKSYGLLDWGRGVWPYQNEWFWSSISTHIDSHVFGLNLGSGFGDTSKATENIVFYKNETHKLGKVTFELKGEYIDEWHIFDDNNRLDLIFSPIYDRTTKAKVLWIDNCTHQMFGYFNGYVILDSGEKILLNNVIDFAEHAINKW